MLTLAWRRMTDALFTPQRAEAAALRHWLADDVHHATLAVIHGRYSRKDGLHFLITFALAYAERAKIDPKFARSVAVGLFRTTLAEHEARIAEAQWGMVDAARKCLSDNPGDFDGAARAAAEVARNNNVPPGAIATALRIAARAA